MDISLNRTNQIFPAGIQRIIQSTRLLLLNSTICTVTIPSRLPPRRQDPRDGPGGHQVDGAVKARVAFPHILIWMSHHGLMWSNNASQSMETTTQDMVITIVNNLTDLIKVQSHPSNHIENKSGRHWWIIFIRKTSPSNRRMKQHSNPTNS